MIRAVAAIVLFAAMVASVSSSASGQTVAVPREVQKWAVYTAQPRYPAEALARRVAGAGIFVMRVQIKTGLVKAVDVARTTGDADLDAAAVNALRQWRFKPGVLPSIKQILPSLKDPFATTDSLVKAPVRFTL